MAIGASNKILNTRIQLKSDTQSHWDEANNFIPLEGELIIYTADTTHSYCRLKVGNGRDTVTNLDFIDAGTINGEEVEIVKLAHYSDKPQVGSSDKLYVDLETNKIYHYTSDNGYSQLSNFKYSATKTPIKNITYWGPGRAAVASVENHTLKLTNGIVPQLLTDDNFNVVTDIYKEGVV